jgi:ribosomal protein L14E/L6E/L27E
VVNLPQPGTLVHSLAGRDAGEYYLVVSISGPNFVFIANGQTRPLSRPKKKNIRHLLHWGQCDAKLAAKIGSRQAHDEEIAQALLELSVQSPPGGGREGSAPDVNEEKRRH